MYTILAGLVSGLLIHGFDTIMYATGGSSAGLVILILFFSVSAINGVLYVCNVNRATLLLVSAISIVLGMAVLILILAENAVDLILIILPPLALILMNLYFKRSKV